MPAIRREYAFLGIVLIVTTFSTVVWTLANRTPPSWDPADHLRTAYDFYQPLSHGQLREFFRELFRTPHAYGPLFHLITAGIFLAAGASRLTGIAANFLALTLLLFSVNWIGDRLHPASRETQSSTFPVRPGAIAALLAVCYHFPAWMIHDAFLDYLLTAMVALTFALLIRADEFHVQYDAIVFGTAAGLGMLAKQTFLFFFILPLAFLWCRALIRRDKTAVTNLVLSMAVVVLIASLWYVPHVNDMIGIYRVNVLNARVEHEPEDFSFRFFAYYWGVLGGMQIQLPFSFLFIAGAAHSIRRRFRQDWMLYLWILSGILAFTWIANKDTRYTVPILPAVALLSVSWLGRVRRSLRLPVFAIIVLWAFVSFFNAQWPSNNRDFRVTVMETPLYFLAGNVFRFDHRPLPEDWSIPAIVRAASGRLGVVPNIWQMNPSNVALYARFYAPQLEVSWLVDDAAQDRLDQCDYVLARTDLENSESVAPLEIVIADYVSAHPDQFIPVATFALPHAQKAVLYKQSLARRERVPRSGR